MSTLPEHDVRAPLVRLLERRGFRRIQTTFTLPHYITRDHEGVFVCLWADGQWYVTATSHDHSFRVLFADVDELDLALVFLNLREIAGGSVFEG